MKKFLTVTVCLLLVAASCAMLVGCNKDTADITAFGEKLVKAESLEIDITMSMPFVGEVRYTTKFEDNKTYSGAFMGSPEMYIVTEEDVQYIYTNNNGVWSKTSQPVEDTEEEFSDEEFLSMFDGDKYEYSKDDKAFKLKEDESIGWSGMTFEDVLLTLEKDSCTIESKVYAEGVSMSVKLEFKNIDNTKITLPEVEE